MTHTLQVFSGREYHIWYKKQDQLFFLPRKLHFLCKLPCFFPMGLYSRQYVLGWIPQMILYIWNLIQTFKMKLCRSTEFQPESRTAEEGDFRCTLVDVHSHSDWEWLTCASLQYTPLWLRKLFSPAHASTIVPPLLLQLSDFPSMAHNIMWDFLVFASLILVRT